MDLEDSDWKKYMEGEKKTRAPQYVPRIFIGHCCPKPHSAAEEGCQGDLHLLGDEAFELKKAVQRLLLDADKAPKRGRVICWARLACGSFMGLTTPSYV